MTLNIVPYSRCLALGIVLLSAYYVHAQDGPHRIEIVATRFDFTPGDINVKKGVPVTLALTSEDVDHGLTFKGLNVVIKGKKGATKEVTFTPNKAGAFVGQCSVFCGAGHGKMKMTLHVTE
jgi:cytochrome c oxidase subunit II